MRLGEIILKNERDKQSKKNALLVRHKLRDLVYTYPKEITRVLNATGFKIQKDLPASVIHAVVEKYVSKNSELREAIGRMLLELDDYVSANGQTMGIIGGALAAVGSVLSGIGRSQATTTPEQQALILQQQQQQQQLEMDQARRRRTTWVVIGISAVVIIGLIVAYKMSRKTLAVAPTNPKLATA
jgi:hypothetical protein